MPDLRSYVAGDSASRSILEHARSPGLSCVRFRKFPLTCDQSVASRVLILRIDDSNQASSLFGTIDGCTHINAWLYGFEYIYIAEPERIMDASHISASGDNCRMNIPNIGVLILSR